MTHAAVIHRTAAGHHVYALRYDAEADRHDYVSSPEPLPTHADAVVAATRRKAGEPA